MTACPVLASSPGRGAWFLPKENKRLNENDELRAEDVFFSSCSQSGSSSCCNPAIKIVFHSAFPLYITDPTTAAPRAPTLTLTPLFTPSFAHMLEVWRNYKKKKKKEGFWDRHSTCFLFLFAPSSVWFTLRNNINNLSTPVPLHTHTHCTFVHFLFKALWMWGLLCCFQRWLRPL